MSDTPRRMTKVAFKAWALGAGPAVWGRAVKWREARKRELYRMGFTPKAAASRAGVEMMDRGNEFLDGSGTAGPAIVPEGKERRGVGEAEVSKAVNSEKVTDRIEAQRQKALAEARQIDAETGRRAELAVELAGEVLAEFEALPESADYLTEVQWVKAHIDQRVLPAEAPSRGAWSWLEHVRSSEKARSEFFNVHVAKLAPSKSQVSGDPRFVDDGRLNDVLAKMLVDGAADRGSIGHA